MFYAWPSRKKHKTLIITNDINRVRRKHCEGFREFEDIPLHEYDDYILLSIEPEVLYESLDEKCLLKDYFERHNKPNIYRRIHM